MFHFEKDIHEYVDSHVNYPTNLLVMDFDSTLFRSPLPSPLLWEKKFIGKIISELEWFRDPQSLAIGSSAMPKSPNLESGWWDLEMVYLVKEYAKKEDWMVILLTGRRRSVFWDRIHEILQGGCIHFDMVGLREEFPIAVCDSAIKANGTVRQLSSTAEYKNTVLDRLLDAIPTISRIHIYDDRPSQLNQFRKMLQPLKEGGRIFEFAVNHIIHETRLQKYLPVAFERKMIVDMIHQYNTSCATKVKRLDAQEMERKLLLQLDPQSLSAIRDIVKPCQNLLMHEYGYIVSGPPDWITPCSDIIRHLGGFNAQVSFFISAFSQVDSDTMLFECTFANASSSFLIMPSPSSSLSSLNFQNIEDQFTTISSQAIFIQGTLCSSSRSTHQAHQPPSQISIGQLIQKYHPEVKGKQMGIVIQIVKTWMEQNGVRNETGNETAVEEYLQSFTLSS